MTREEAIQYAEKKIDSASYRLEMGYLNNGLRQIVSNEYEFFKQALSALRQQEHFREVTKKVEPLTLDELRKLPIRDWVWIEILNPDAFRSKETVSAYYRKYDGYKADEIFWCGYPGLGFGFDYSDYGKAWLAYRQKPEEDDHDERKESEHV